VHTALLVIDAQVGFFEGEFTVYQAQTMLKRIQKLVERARNAHALVVYIQHDTDPDIDGPIHPAIAPTEHDLVVPKYTPDAFHETDLHQQLTTRGIHKVILTGFQTELCVDTTCRRAWDLGYEVWLAKDAHSTFEFDGAVLTAEETIAHHSRILDAFATVEPADQLLFE
jgi:nicotinamidase-related amidase